MPHSLPERFFGPNVFQKVLDRFDIGAGDRFYDSPGAYDRPWDVSKTSAQSSLLVTYGTRGELGEIRYVIERRATGSDKWPRGAEQITTQREFRSMVTALP